MIERMRIDRKRMTMALNRMDPRFKIKKDPLGIGKNKTDEKYKKKKFDGTGSTLIDRIKQMISDLIAICALAVLFAILYFIIPPRNSYFMCSDIDIVFPYMSETIQLWAAAVIAIAPTMILILLVEFRNAEVCDLRSDDDEDDDDIGAYDEEISTMVRAKTFFICAGHAITLFFLGMAATVLLVEIGTRSIGRLKPNFLDACKPNYTLINCTTTEYNGTVAVGISTANSFCSGNASKVKESRMSFPSPHSAYVSYGMVFLAMYLQARLRLLTLRVIKNFLQIAAFFITFFISCTRVSDYHARISDVFAGLCIGAGIALFMIFVVGHVLWEFKTRQEFTEFRQKPPRYVKSKAKKKPPPSKVDSNDE